MNIEESNFSEELASSIKKRKISVITKLVNKLDIDAEDDDYYNAAAVLTELL